MRRYLSSAAVVGEYLADQLLLPMVLGRGGEFTTLKPSLHCQTNRKILNLFSNRSICFEEISKDHWLIQVEGD